MNVNRPPTSFSSLDDFEFQQDLAREKESQKKGPSFSSGPGNGQKAFFTPGYDRQVEELIQQGYARRKKVGNLTRKEADMFEAIEKSVILGTDLPDLKLSDRPAIFEPWLQIGDYGILFSKRGLGKTFFLLFASRAITEGRNLGPWTNKAGPKKVLYVDGEMPIHGSDGMQDRWNRMKGGRNPNFLYLHHTQLFEIGCKTLNLLDPDTQAALLHFCKSRKIEVVIFDSLATLFFPPKAAPLTSALYTPWMLQFKAANITMILVHHAGKNLEQRGDSGIEDYAAFSLDLRDGGPVPGLSRAAHFILHNTKPRHGHMDPVEWTFSTPDDPPEGENRPELKSPTKVEWKIYRFEDSVLRLVREGVNKPADIASKLKIDAADVSIALKRLEEKELVEEKAYRYSPVNRTKQEGRAADAAAPREPNTLAGKVLALFVPGGAAKTLEEIRAALPKVPKTSLPKTLDSLLKNGGLQKQEIPNPKAGQPNQRAHISAWRRSATVITPPSPEGPFVSSTE